MVFEIIGFMFDKGQTKYLPYLLVLLVTVFTYQI
jgi:hypothetical protein